jgi:3',5'-cyclic AMP phosphodiesterase CpdA
MRIAITADLHWGHHPAGDAATRLLVQHLEQNPPDLLLLGGDLGTGDHFDECLALFRTLPSRKALVPGNHDIWVTEADARGDSWDVYDSHLPTRCANAGFHYLDHTPLVLPERQLAIVGTINWYDYSWALDRLRREVPDWEVRLRNMAFTRGRHNDRRFVRWPLTDGQFTERVVARFEAQLRNVFEQVEHALILTHHPAFYGLGFPRPGAPSVPDGLLWDAFAGNIRLEDILTQHAARISLVFSGHTHRARENQLGSLRGYNIGGDYHFKRLAEVTWPGAAVCLAEFVAHT